MFNVKTKKKSNFVVRWSEQNNSNTWDIYRTVRSQLNFHQTYFDVQRKHLKMMAGHHDLTNNRKNHHVLAVRLYSIVVRINNTAKFKKKTKMKNVIIIKWKQNRNEHTSEYTHYLMLTKCAHTQWRMNPSWRAQYNWIN